MSADWFKDAVIYELHVRAFMDSTTTVGVTSTASRRGSTTSPTSA
jgi:pullulanase/glycogen debranching enzyme